MSYLAVRNDLNVESAVDCAVAGSALAIVFRLIADRPKLWTMKRSLVSAIAQTGIRFHLAQVIEVLGNQADRIVVVTFFAPHDVGIYVLSVALANAPVMATTPAFVNLLLPQVSAAKTQEAKTHIVSSYLKLVILLSAVLLLAYGFVLPLIVPVLLGAGFEQTVHIGRILLIAFGARQATQVMVTGARGHHDWSIPLVTRVAILAGFVGAAALMQGLGLYGIALASVAASLVGLAVSVVAYAAKYSCRLSAFWPFDISVYRFLVVLWKEELDGRRIGPSLD